MTVSLSMSPSTTKSMPRLSLLTEIGSPSSFLAWMSMVDEPAFVEGQLQLVAAEQVDAR